MTLDSSPNGRTHAMAAATFLALCSPVRAISQRGNAAPRPGSEDRIARHVHVSAGAEGHASRPSAARLTLAQRVTDGEDRPVLFGLLDERIALGVRVFIDVRIAIEVIIGHVQESTYSRVKPMDVLELKTRHLENDDVKDLVGVIGQGLTEISPTNVRLP